MLSGPAEFRVLSVFNRYLERGGEEDAVERIAEALGGIVDLQQCTFSSQTWKDSLVPPPLQALWMLYNPSSLAILGKQQREARFDFWLVHNVFPVGSAAVYREALRLEVPIIQYIHNFRPFSVSGYLWAGDHVAAGGLRLNFWEEIRCGTWQDSRGKTAWLALVLRTLHSLHWLRSVRAWIAISDFTREKFIEAGIPAEDIFTLRHFWKPRPVLPPWRDEGHYLFLGRLIAAKGIRVLFEAWQLLEEALGSRTPKLIIGGDGPLRSEVAGRATASQFIRYAGQLRGEEKEAAILGSRAMLAPSLWWEPLGLVTYEAYDAGKPMLAARSGGLTETVLDGVTGYLHEPGDARQLAAQIIELEQDFDRRLTMGRAGRAWLEEHADEGAWQRKFREVAEYATRKRPTCA